jgi:hypothetical protein
MTKTFLIATVAAFAITAPAQAAGPGERRANSEQQAKQKRNAQRAAPAPRTNAQRAAPAPRTNARARTAAPRAQARTTGRAEAPRARARVQARQRVEIERPTVEVRRRVATQRPQPQVRTQDRRERQASQVEVRSRQQHRVNLANRARTQRVEAQPRAAVRARISPPGLQRRAEVHARNAIRFQQRRELQEQRKLQLRTRQLAGARTLVERRDDDQRDARSRRLVLESLLKRPSRRVGDRIDVRRQLNRDRYDDYLARRYSRFAPSPRYVYDYNYNDGYLYKVDRERNAIAALYPLIGGAFSVAQRMPVGFNSYNVPSAYRSLYYDTPNYQYRYGDGAIYRVDPKTQMIQTVVALLTGQNLGVGQMLPAGYEVYNVPYAYRQRFADRDDRWYRYSDGNIYGVDPYSRRIQSMYPMSYGGYSVGYPVPSYASYGGYTGFGGSYGGYPSQSMPYGYNQLYYGQPGYNYQYANGGIYQVDPTTRLVSALVALVTGTNLGIGQVLPRGFDAYNVPSAYRSTYFDTPDAWYRYNNGNIYQVDPYSRVVQASMPLSYGGYMVGQPVPQAYPGYAVPNQYAGLYNTAPGYDYRYSNGGIYQVNPQNQIVQSQVALLTGQTFGVGQMMPAGYDAYNVPFAYRDRYYDAPGAMYRYADGNIYQIDPTTRLIQAVIDAIV